MTRTDDPPTAPRRRTRAEQRAATRLSLLDSAATCLGEDGYAGLTTRNVAQRAGVSQSTLMHYFPTREAFLVETVTHVAVGLAEEVVDRIDLTDLQRPDRREAVLDETWRQFTSSGALAAVQLWNAAWTEPEIASTIRELEERVVGIITVAATAVFPDQADDPAFGALIDTAVSVIRGLVMGIPIQGPEAVDARWRAIKPILLATAAGVLDGRGNDPTDHHPSKSARLLATGGDSSEQT